MWTPLVFPQVRGSVRTNIDDAFEVFPHCFEPLFSQILLAALHMRSTSEVAKFDQETSANGY